MGESQHALKLPVRFWVHLLSHLGSVAIVAGMLADWAGIFFEALAEDAGATNDGSWVGCMGRVLGFCAFAMLWLGALTIPGELFGLIRPYGRNAPYRQQAQAMHRKVLLIVLALLSWGCLVSAVVIGASMRSG